MCAEGRCPNVDNGVGGVRVTGGEGGCLLYFFYVLCTLSEESTWYFIIIKEKNYPKELVFCLSAQPGPPAPGRAGLPVQVHLRTTL